MLLAGLLRGTRAETAPQWFPCHCLHRMRHRSTFCAVSATMYGSTLNTQRAHKGDYGFNVFHNSNPQHGGSYARHERRMREEEVEDFLKSVKHWLPVYEDVADGDLVDEGQSSSSSTSASAAEPPLPRLAHMGEEAIMRTFRFETFREAYLFMGRVWAFCYGSDKYPHVTWEGTAITVYLYSPSFRGLSKREARVAAFLNDQYNMLRKSKWQQRRIVDGIVREAAVEKLFGEEVAAHLAHRQSLRTAPLQEMKDGPRRWRSAIGLPLHGPNSGSDGAGGVMGGG
ncbi:hypothetical protein, conserved [Leishmania tarentolae]|uniref:4a-hydroxytetrahydrobiopterin dehydratase n=1 Tax=Leishmania tarentolae TaxID=5689 RepID=A0A640K9X9_LEITA|nr:hypothetical protein, conserved [Leishmania tarentolae]